MRRSPPTFAGALRECSIVDEAGTATYTAVPARGCASPRASGQVHPRDTLHVPRTRFDSRDQCPLAAAFLFLLAFTGCRGGSRPDPPAVNPDEGEHHPMVGQTAPDFVGEVPGGGWLQLRGFRDKPVALLIFRPRAPFSRELVEAFGRFRGDRAMAPTAFVGIALDSIESIGRFGEATGGALPTVRDPGPIARDYGVDDAAVVILIDSRRFVRFRMDGFAGPRFRQRLEAVAKALRRLPAIDELPAREIRLDYTKDPRAPVFTARDIDGRVVDLAALRGHVVVLNFFDQECAHCQEDLPRLVPVLKELRPRGVRAIGVASRDAGGGMRRFMKEHGIDYPVIIDADRSLFARFESTRTPDLFIIDGLGFIPSGSRGTVPIAPISPAFRSAWPSARRAPPRWPRPSRRGVTSGTAGAPRATSGSGATGSRRRTASPGTRCPAGTSGRTRSAFPAT